MSTVVMVRKYDEAPSKAEIDAMNSRIGGCLEINDASWITTYASLDGKEFVCVFEARDLESVRRAVESAGFVYKSLFAANQLTPA